MRDPAQHPRESPQATVVHAGSGRPMAVGFFLVAAGLMAAPYLANGPPGMFWGGLFLLLPGAMLWSRKTAHRLFVDREVVGWTSWQTGEPVHTTVPLADVRGLVLRTSHFGGHRSAQTLERELRIVTPNGELIVPPNVWGAAGRSAVPKLIQALKDRGVEVALTRRDETGA